VLDHVGLNVRDFATARAFYAAALEPLGIAPVMEFPGFCGFGDGQKPYFWIGERDEPTTPAHVAFASPDRATVDAFHEAALAAGGRDNGAPGLRAYHEHYYGAFVLDPDGNNVEAVCHLPPSA
jgi:catechol 2,3-dioxygenase-like lactoylglutathione lyase family enzyme